MSNRAANGLTWIVSADLTADYTSSVIDMMEHDQATLAWQWSGTSTPIGSFYIQGSVDQSTWYNIYIDNNRVYGATFTHAGATAIAVNSASDGYALVVVQDCPPFLRLFWDKTGAAGGSATGLNGQFSLRAF